MAENSANEKRYLSRYEHGVDEKRRVQIPAKWRSEEEITYTVMFWQRSPEQPACLLVLPPLAMSRLVEKISAMPFNDPYAENLRRQLGANSDQVVPDKTGRICLPDEMAKKAGIDANSKAILIGMFDRFQIWNPEKYNAVSVVDQTHSSQALGLI